MRSLSHLTKSQSWPASLCLNDRYAHADGYSLTNARVTDSIACDSINSQVSTGVPMVTTRTRLSAMPARFADEASIQIGETVQEECERYERQEYDRHCYSRDAHGEHTTLGSAELADHRDLASLAGRPGQGLADHSIGWSDRLRSRE